MDEEEEDLEGKGVGWPDAVGDGWPFAVPMSLDYFQGFLVQAGVSGSTLPGDRRTLSPQQALELVPLDARGLHAIEVVYTQPML